MQRILLIRAGRIGDTIFASAAMSALWDYFAGRCVFDWIISPPCKTLFTYDQRVTACFVLPHRKIPYHFSAEKKALIKQLQTAPYDLVINFETTPYLDSFSKRLPAKLVLTRPQHVVSPIPETEHAIVTHLRMLDFLPFTVPYDTAKPCLFGPVQATLRDKFKLPDNYLIVSPANSQVGKGKIDARAWPPAHWKALLDLLATQADFPIVLIGTEQDKVLLEMFGPLPPGVISLMGKTNLPELIGVIRDAKGLIVTDTGTVHMAASVGTPVVGIFGPTNFHQTGPLMETSKRILLSPFIPSDYCDYDPLCPIEAATRRIQPEQVLHAVNTLFPASISA